MGRFGETVLSFHKNYYEGVVRPNDKDNNDNNNNNAYEKCYFNNEDDDDNISNNNITFFKL